MSESDQTRPLEPVARRAEASPAEPIGPGRVLSQKYRIERHIGSGGMGAVFEAVHLVTGKRVALKVLSGHGAANRERFVREAQTAGRIKHPNIVDVYDVAEDGAEIYLVMELLVGEPLRARIARGPMDPPEAVSLLMPALRGVAAAHAEGIVHRDLKPENIFLCDRGVGIAPEAKVLDFGLSKDLELAREARPHNLTMTNAVMGTALYMAPEQAVSSKRVDHRADVYALALVLYEMVAGRRLLAAHAHQELSAQLANAVPPFRREWEVSETARALERVLLTALTKAPTERTQSVEDLAHALEPFGHITFEGGLRMSMLRSASPASVPAPPSQPATRVGPLVWSALAIATLAAAGWVLLR